MLREQKAQTLHLLIGMPDAECCQVVQFLPAALEFISVRLLLHRKIAVQIAVHILFPCAPAPEILEPDKSLVFHVIFHIIQKILRKFLLQKPDILHNLKAFIQQLPYLLRQIDMVHQIDQKPLPGLQRRIQAVTDRILQKLPPLSFIGAAVHITVACVNPVDPLVELCLFLRRVSCSGFPFLLRRRRKRRRSLIRRPKPLKALRIILRIRLL